jgi:GT2 family glycosyltransferase
MLNNIPKISVIILNWNWWQDTIECLESLYRIDYPYFEVILIDNFSTNDSVEKIIDWTKWKIEVKGKYFNTTTCTHDISVFTYTKQELDLWEYRDSKSTFCKNNTGKKLFLLKSDMNYWFAGWCNLWIRQVISEGESDHVFLLNNDTVMEKSYLTDLVRKMQKFNQEEIGCIWGKIFNYYTDDYWIRHHRDYKNQQVVPCLTWAWLLLSVRALKEMWLFDEYLFLYCEDYDLTYRISKKYYNYYLHTESKIYHKSEASSSNILEKKLILQIRNQFILYKRHSEYFSLLSFLRTLIIFWNNNRKIHFFIACKALFLGVIYWLLELIRNKWPIW